MWLQWHKGAGVCEQNRWSSEMNFLYRPLSIFFYFNRWHKRHKHRHTLARSSPGGGVYVDVVAFLIGAVRSGNKRSQYQLWPNEVIRRGIPTWWLVVLSLWRGQLLPSREGGGKGGGGPLVTFAGYSGLKKMCCVYKVGDIQVEQVAVDKFFVHHTSLLMTSLKGSLMALRPCMWKSHRTS